MEYIRKPQQVEAIQWTGDNLGEVQAFVGKNYNVVRKSKGIILIYGTETGYEYENAALEWYIVKTGYGCIETYSQTTFGEMFESFKEKVEKEVNLMSRIFDALRDVDVITAESLINSDNEEMNEFFARFKLQNDIFVEEMTKLYNRWENEANKAEKETE